MTNRARVGILLPMELQVGDVPGTFCAYACFGETVSAGEYFELGTGVWTFDCSVNFR